MKMFPMVNASNTGEKPRAETLGQTPLYNFHQNEYLNKNKFPEPHICSQKNKTIPQINTKTIFKSHKVAKAVWKRVNSIGSSKITGCLPTVETELKSDE